MTLNFNTYQFCLSQIKIQIGMSHQPIGTVQHVVSLAATMTLTQSISGAFNIRKGHAGIVEGGGGA